MTEATWSPDDDAASGESSHEADVNAGFDSEDQDSTAGLLGAPENAGLADSAGGTESSDSHAADVDAGYDDSDGSASDDDDVTPATGIR